MSSNERSKILKKLKNDYANFFESKKPENALSEMEPSPTPSKTIEEKSRSQQLSEELMGEVVMIDNLALTNFEVVKNIGTEQEKRIIENDDEVTFDHLTKTWHLGTKGPFCVAFTRMDVAMSLSEKEMDVNLRLKQLLQHFLNHLGIYTSYRSTKVRKKGNFNFVEISNHQIFKEDVRLLLQVNPPRRNSEQQIISLFLQCSRFNWLRELRDMKIQAAFIPSRFMNNRKDYKPYLDLVIQRWVLVDRPCWDQGTQTSPLSGSNDRVSENLYEETLNTGLRGWVGSESKNLFRTVKFVQ